MPPPCPCDQCARRAATRKLHARWRTVAAELPHPELRLRYAADKAMDLGRSGVKLLAEVLQLDRPALEAEVKRLRALPVPVASRSARPPAAPVVVPAPPLRSPSALALARARGERVLYVRAERSALKGRGKVDLAALAAEGEPRPYVSVGPPREGPALVVAGLGQWLTEQAAQGVLHVVVPEAEGWAELLAALGRARSMEIHAHRPGAEAAAEATASLFRVLCVDLATRTRVDLRVEGPPGAAALKARLDPRLAGDISATSE